MRVSATVISGFLGAGKTTLIRRLLSEASGNRHFALIVNEFGDVGVDGETLASCGEARCGEDDIIELTNGCICCTVADDFLPSMRKLLARDPVPDHIIIETSGLALPQPLVQAFSWQDIRTKVMLDGVITVVDGAALAEGVVASDLTALEAQRQADPELDHETPIDELFIDQVSAANILIITKSDLIKESQLAEVKVRLEAITEGNTPIIVANNLGGELETIFGLGLEDEAFARSNKSHHHHDHDDDHHGHDHDHDHDAFHSVVLKLPVFDDSEHVTARLKEAASKHDLLRAKGFVAIKDKSVPFAVQAVGQRVEGYFGGSGLDVNGSGRLVLIGLKETDMSAIARMLGGEVVTDAPLTH